MTLLPLFARRYLAERWYRKTILPQEVECRWEAEGECPYCTNEACALCNGPCDHDVIERHQIWQPKN